MGQIEPSSGPSTRCAYRGPGDDFFCLRFGVWYPSFECAVRTRFRTCQGCLECDQGRFNLRRHQQHLERRLRWSPGGV